MSSACVFHVGSMDGCHLCDQCVYFFCLQRVQKSDGKDSLPYAKALCDLAWVYNDQGSYSNAEEAARQALGVFRREYGLAHADTLTALAR